MKTISWKHWWFKSMKLILPNCDPRVCREKLIHRAFCSFLVELIGCTSNGKNFPSYNKNALSFNKNCLSNIFLFICLSSLVLSQSSAKSLLEPPPVWNLILEKSLLFFKPSLVVGGLKENSDLFGLGFLDLGLGLRLVNLMTNDNHTISRCWHLWTRFPSPWRTWWAQSCWQESRQGQVWRVPASSEQPCDLRCHDDPPQSSQLLYSCLDYILNTGMVFEKKYHPHKQR